MSRSVGGHQMVVKNDEYEQAFGTGTLAAQLREERVDAAVI
jgi:hypothetical protein